MAKSIAEWLSGESRFRLDISMIENIVEDRGFETTQSHSEVDKISKKLLYADLLRKAYNSPSTVGSYSNKHNTFEENWGAEVNLDKIALRNTFMSIYRLYDTTLYAELSLEYETYSITQVRIID